MDKPTTCPVCGTKCDVDRHSEITWAHGEVFDSEREIVRYTYRPITLDALERAVVETGLAYDDAMTTAYFAQSDGDKETRVAAREQVKATKRRFRNAVYDLRVARSAEVTP